MKLKHLPTDQRKILDEKVANLSEKWAKNPALHPTIDTYFEAFFKGARSALNLPVIPMDTAIAISKAIIEREPKDKDRQDRMWKLVLTGDAGSVEQAFDLTREPVKPEKPSDPDGLDVEVADPDEE